MVEFTAKDVPVAPTSLHLTVMDWPISNIADRL